MKEKELEIKKKQMKPKAKENESPPKSRQEFKEANISEYIKHQRLEKLNLSIYGDDLL